MKVDRAVLYLGAKMYFVPYFGRLLSNLHEILKTSEHIAAENCEFRENRRTEGRYFLTWLNEITSRPVA